jgi:pimeloyl-ACP methyl ester carboxylesterase
MRNVDGYAQFTQLIQTGDGRTLAYADYGDPTGAPVLFFHGSPGCRLPLAEHVEIAREVGVRIIAPDRPGYGRSDPKPGRTLLDWTVDVAALADHLHLERFAVVGNSGGAIHAAACAAKLSTRVLTAALVACPPPPQLPELVDQLPWQERLVGRLGRRAPGVLRVGTEVSALLCRHAPSLFVELVALQVSQPGRQLLRHPPTRQQMMHRYQEAYRQGGMGHAEDLRLMGQDWGFALSALCSPVCLWHGTRDQVFPSIITEQLANHIPQARICWAEEGSHLFLKGVKHWRQVLHETLMSIEEPKRQEESAYETS